MCVCVSCVFCACVCSLVFDEFDASWWGSSQWRIQRRHSGRVKQFDLTFGWLALNVQPNLNRVRIQSERSCVDWLVDLVELSLDWIGWHLLSRMKNNDLVFWFAQNTNRQSGDIDPWSDWLGANTTIPQKKQNRKERKKERKKEIKKKKRKVRKGQFWHVVFQLSPSRPPTALLFSFQFCPIVLT